MKASETAAAAVARRLQPRATAIDPGLLDLLRQVIAGLVAKLRACLDDADEAFDYLSAPPWPDPFGGRTRRWERRIAGAIEDVVTDKVVKMGMPVQVAPFADTVAAVRAAIRNDLSRGLVHNLYEESR